MRPRVGVWVRYASPSPLVQAATNGNQLGSTLRRISLAVRSIGICRFLLGTQPLAQFWTASGSGRRARRRIAAVSGSMYELIRKSYGGQVYNSNRLLLLWSRVLDSSTPRTSTQGLPQQRAAARLANTVPA